MTDSPVKDYQRLYPGDKRKIIEKLKKLLEKLYDAYGPNYHEDLPVEMIILSNKETIRDFMGLMRSEVKSYTGKVTINNDTPPNKLQTLSVKMQDSDKCDPVNKHQTIILSDEVKKYIKLIIQDIVSKQLDEKIKPIFGCLNQYEEEIRVYREREAKFRERKMDDFSDLHVNNQDVNICKNVDMLAKKMKENCKQKNSAQTIIPKYSFAESVDLRESKNVGAIDILPNNIQEQIKVALDIYNKNTATDNLSIRRRIEKTFNKQMERLVLPKDDANEFANKPIKDLKNDKTYQAVSLERTDGAGDYIAAPVSEKVYAVFPVKFEPYNQKFAWERAYPLFFEIFPNDELKTDNYILEQPAFFQKNGDKYQMIKGGKGRIELEK